MATLKILVLVILFISYSNGASDNPPCSPTIKNVPFAQFMESMTCEVDENLLELFTNEKVFSNSIVKNPFANFMCIGLMDALTLVPETLCDLLDPLSGIPDDEFCSSAKIATLRKISDVSVFDNTSNIFIVSKFTVGKCDQMCNGDANQLLCWAFGIIAKAVFKHALSTHAPTSVAAVTTTTAVVVAPKPSPLPVLPALTSQGNAPPKNSNDGGVDSEDSEEKEESNDLTNKPTEDNDNPSTTTTATGVAQFFDDNKVSNNSQSSDKDVDTSGGDGKESSKESHEDNENKNKESEGHLGEEPTNTVSIPGPGNVDTDGNSSNSPDEVSDKSNQTVSSNEPTNTVSIPGPGNVDTDGNSSNSPDEVSDKSNHTISSNEDTGVKEQLDNNGTDTNNVDQDDHKGLDDHDENVVVDDNDDNNNDGDNHYHSNDSNQGDINQDVDSNQDSTGQNPTQSDVNFHNTIGDDNEDDDDDGYSYWHFAAILLFILFLGVAGYLASLNRKKVSIAVVLYVCDV